MCLYPVLAGPRFHFRGCVVGSISSLSESALTDRELGLKLEAVPILAHYKY